MERNPPPPQSPEEEQEADRPQLKQPAAVHAAQHSHLFADFQRSSSAPPTQFKPPSAATPSTEDDIRANPQYAAYFYSNSRLDPRLPPPIYEPGQSWQMWSSPAMSQSLLQQPHSAADPQMLSSSHSSGGSNSMGAARFNQPPPSLQPTTNNAGWGQQHPSVEPPPGFVRSTTPVGAGLMRQAEFRSQSPVLFNQQRSMTPNPTVTKMYQQPAASAVDEFLELRMASKTPPPSHLSSMASGQQIGAGIYNTLISSAPPRSSSTPPQQMPYAQPQHNGQQRFGKQQTFLGGSPLASSTRSSRDMPQQDYYGEGLYQQVDDQETMLLANSMSGVVLDDHYDYPQQQQQHHHQGFNMPRPSSRPSSPQFMQSMTTASAPAQNQHGEYLAKRGAMYPPGQQRYGQHHQSGRMSNSPTRQNGGYGHQSPTMGNKKPPSRNAKPMSAGANAVRSALLEEFRSSRNQNRFDLKTIAGHVVEFSGDQHGSRFIQQRLETASSEEKQAVFNEVVPNCIQLMTDVFGNYVVQKFFEFGNQAQKTALFTAMQGHVLALSLQMYGCRVVQKALEFLLNDQQIAIINELDGHIIKCVKDQNGNHVIQKAIERISPKEIQFILQAFEGQVVHLATHPYGCRVMQRIFEFCPPDATRVFMQELFDSIPALVRDQYGNYVVQHIIEQGSLTERQRVFEVLRSEFYPLSKHKFASNVMEKIVKFASMDALYSLFDDLAKGVAGGDGEPMLILMMKDAYANYVVQKMIDVGDATILEKIVNLVRPMASQLRKVAYGKHIVGKLEKVIPDKMLE